MFLQKILRLFDFTLLPRGIWRNRTLFQQLVKRNIASRYRGSILGLVWSFVQPLMMLCVYTFVFSVIFKAKWGVSGGGDSKGAFAIIMFCGVSLYNIFAESVTNSSRVILENPNFVKKVVFPLEILPLVQVFSSFVLGMCWIVFLFGGVVFIFGKISFTMLLLPLIMIPLFFFTLGVSFIVASLAVYIRDTQYVIGVVLQILFFITPIFYPISIVPRKFQFPMLFNPLAILIENMRKIFIYGSLPDWNFVGVSFFISILILHLGFIWFYKTKRGFADVL